MKSNSRQGYGVILGVAIMAFFIREDVSTPQANKPVAAPVSTSPHVHDPVMAREDGIYYVFSTGRGIPFLTSKDRVTWHRQGRVFDKPLSWTGTAIAGSGDNYWAPDISYFNGKWHLYYSVSTFGSNHSAIGLATSATLDPAKPGYGWKDEGLVIESKRGDDWNAIDPNLVLDEQKRPWLSFGSFWSGIKLVPLDEASGKPSNLNLPLYSLAGRGGGAIEAPFIVAHDGRYYLFVSFDLCCRGAESTYNIRVGRASQMTGPYFDRDGQPMLQGGGTLVRSGSARWRGPGHNAVYHENGQDFLVYHAYDAQDNGVSKLRIEEMKWDEQDWPTVPVAPQ